MSRIRCIAACIAALALAIPIAVSAPAQAASPTAGLYGSQDPAYDGAFRQSLAIMGLTAAGVQPSPSAVKWLLSMQCADGSFQMFRADPAQPCSPVDLANFTGPDTNATAMAAEALRGVATPAATKAAGRAAAWLFATQNADGGWPYLRGGASDANSTGLVLAALRARSESERRAALSRGQRFLASVMAPCGTPDGGGLAYMPGSKVDGSASAQGYLGVTSALPVEAEDDLGANPRCARNLEQKLGSYLAGRIAAAGGALPSAMGGGADYTNTAFAVLGLSAAGIGRPSVAKAMSTLRANARSFAIKDGAAVPAAIGLLLLAAEATGANPVSFGGVDLVKALQGSERR